METIEITMNIEYVVEAGATLQPYKGLVIHRTKTHVHLKILPDYMDCPSVAGKVSPEYPFLTVEISEVIPESKLKYRCPECGSTDLQVKGWIQPNNDNKYIQICSGEEDDSYCCYCDERINLSNI